MKWEKTVMRLIVYGTLRKGEALSYALPKSGKCETLELSGLQLYVVGECPGAKLGTREDKAIVELWEFNFTKRTEKKLLHRFDLMEGVHSGLYERNYIDTPRGKSLIYTICGNVKGCPQIKDWKEWQKRNRKTRILSGIYIKTV
jgi:gamma-glutamylcyclotransferase (GGCT)/AIG2-like uncharacterized protein YtfP